jgi:signal transduction histidine kinase
VRLGRGLLWALGATSAAIALALMVLLATSDLVIDRALWIVLDLVIGGGFTGMGLFAAELRELARGIHPSVLTDRGLYAALDGLAQRAPLPVEFKGTPADRLPDRVESAAYFVVAEALTNVAKYARATHASVNVRHLEDGQVLVEITDDGVGGADPSTGPGLRGLLDRVAAVGGRLELDSPPGKRTTVRAAIPL